MTEALYEVDAPHFHAGFTTKDNVIESAAPIIKYMIGWTVEHARAYSRSKGWYVHLIQESENG